MLEEQEMEYLYDDGEYYYFMNTENYEQMHLMKDMLGDAVSYLIPQLQGDGGVLRRQADQRGTAGHRGHDGGRDRARHARAPRVSNVTKPAKMETGLVVQVPPFITEGEKIRVNTAEGTYQERA